MMRPLKGFRQVDPAELNLNAISSIGTDFMEIVAGNPSDGVNAMTAAWGGLGYMWELPVAFVVIRGEEYRYTRHIVDREPLFSLCFLPNSLNEAKTYLGVAHGWDDKDKIGSAGLTHGYCGLELEHVESAGIGEHVHVPFIEESSVVLICEKICTQELGKESVMDSALWSKWYNEEGQHCLYIAAIRAAFVKE